MKLDNGDCVGQAEGFDCHLLEQLEASTGAS